ncbi:MAG: bifunctional metallophosphatase/5'-nucleotidase [Bacteroidota bacterium]
MRRLTALACSTVFLAGCSFQGLSLFGASSRTYQASKVAIPTQSGVPQFGQQPLIPADPALAGKTVPLTLLYTSDIHSRIDPFPDNYYYRTYAGKGGYARIATLSRKIRHEIPASLLLDSGDALEGSPYYNFFKGEADLKVMEQLDYDAITLGNHDFSGGVAALRQLYRPFPLVTSNITFQPDLGQRYVVRKVGSLRVGIFAVHAKADGLIKPSSFQSAQYYDPIQVARRAVEKLSSEADFIVCISHVGVVPPWEDDDAVSTGEITDERIAAQVPGIDVVLSGHTHALVKTPVSIKSGTHRALIVSPGFGGGFLGRLDLQVKDGEVQTYNNDLLPVDSSVAKASDVESVIASYRSKMDAVVKQTIGNATAEFKRYAGKDYESALNNLVADSTLTAARTVDPSVDFGMSSSGTPRCPIPAGTIRVEDAYYSLPFENQIVIVEAKGKAVVDMLTTQRRNTDNKRHAVSNVSYLLDPAAHTISDIKIGGKPFDPNRVYKVAVNDYMAEGGSGFSMLSGLKRRDTGVYQRDALIDHIRKARTISPEMGRIRIKP